MKNVRTANPEPPVNTSNNLLVSPILTLLVVMNSIQQIFKAFQFNHKPKSFKTINFRLYFIILLLPKRYTLQSIQHNLHSYIKLIIISINPNIQPIKPNNQLHSCYTPFCQNYLNNNTLYTLIHWYMHISQYTDLIIYIKTNLGPFINNNSLHTNINLYTDFNTNIDLSMYIRINTDPANINLYQLTTSLLLPRYEIITNVFLST